MKSWLTVKDGRTPAVIVSVAHLDDDERAFVLGVLLEEILTWVRGLSGSKRLRALVVFDEVYGFLPPHPANPPTKRPLVSLMKQARAFGVGVVIATQNPMDLDYRALGNAGMWCVGRLQTDADRARVLSWREARDAGSLDLSLRARRRNRAATGADRRAAADHSPNPEIAHSHPALRYHSRVRRMPSRKDTCGAYPSSPRARAMSNARDFVKKSTRRR